MERRRYFPSIPYYIHHVHNIISETMPIAKPHCFDQPTDRPMLPAKYGWHMLFYFYFYFIFFWFPLTFRFSFVLSFIYYLLKHKLFTLHFENIKQVKQFKQQQKDLTQRDILCLMFFSSRCTTYTFI